MASRSSIRQGRRDRPRSSAMITDARGRKKREGTPEKSSTPSASCEEDLDTQKRAIMNDEILALQIKEDDLLKLREPRPPTQRKTTPVFNSVVVKKLRLITETEKQKSIVVMKPAPRDAAVKTPDYSGLTGPRFDESNNIIPHSILGNVDDFMVEAIRQGDLALEGPAETSTSSACLPVKHESRKVRCGFPKFESVYESNALKNWDANMAERRRQQNYLSRVLDKPVDHLVMNQSEGYRRVQELRNLIDRTIPFVDRGKGYTPGTEFWSQPTNFGGELTGLHTTLTETEKGYPPAVQHIGVPNSVLTEKGLSLQPPPQPYGKPWHKAPYLHDRVLQLAPLMNELDPYEPDIGDLEVVGNCQRNVIVSHQPQSEGQISSRPGETLQSEESGAITMDNQDPLRDHPDVYPDAIFGPSLQIGGSLAQWTGDPCSQQGEVGLEARVFFEAFAGERTMSFLEIGNNGTTAIYYDWKRIPKENPFDLVTPQVQRFYFSQSHGVLLPGAVMKFPFVFKSPNAGIFSEQWEFQTHPVLCGGAQILVTLRGVALKQDKFEQDRAELEQELSRRQAEQVVSTLLEDMLSGIKTPERSRSPIDAYITEKELFSRKNPEQYFVRDKFNALNNLYVEALPDDQKALPWDLNISTVKEAILDLGVDDGRQEDLLKQFNEIVTSISFKPLMSTCVTTYTAGCTILSEAVDRIVKRDGILRTLTGLPGTAQDQRSAQPLARRDAKLKSTRGKNDLKEKKSSKDGKQLTGKTTKELLAPGGSRAGSSLSKGGSQTGLLPDKSASQLSAVVDSTMSVAPVPVIPADDPAVQAKYKNSLYTQTYLTLCEMVTDMESVFDELVGKSNRSPLSCPEN